MHATPERRRPLARLAHWCVRHRGRVLAGWILALVVVLAAASAVGTHTFNNFTLPGTQSQRAVDVLERGFPKRAGDVDQIVFRATEGRITDPAVRARIAPVLARVARLPHVSSVTSPSAGAGSIARDGRIAFATVTFDEAANELPKQAVERVVSTAREAAGNGVQVELGGQAIELIETTSFGALSALGLAAAIVVLLIAFGSVIAAGLPVITALLGLGTAFGLIGLASHVVEMPTYADELAAMIGLGVGIDYALLIVTRFREARRTGDEPEPAAVLALTTAGRAVLLAGSTVIVALLGMLVLDVRFLAALAISSAIGVLCVMLAAVTVLPALLAGIGRRAGGPAEAAAPRTGFWERWARLVSRRPWPAAIAGMAIMLVIAAPALSMRLSVSDAGNEPTTMTTRKAYDLLARGFGPGFNGPLEVVVQLPRAGDGATLARVGTALRSAPDVASVGAPAVNGRTAVLQAFPRSAPQASATTALVKALRSRVLPPVAHATGATVLVGGVTAGGVDFTHVLSAKLPVFIAVVIGVAALLLLIVFRSFAIPVQAAGMNLLSVGAAFGVSVAVFQWGWLGGVIGVDRGPIDPWVPVLLFAILFGLSMDYEVFLVSRIHEAWTRSRDASGSVVEGIATTGRVITAAATIMVCVFLAFVLDPTRPIKLFGLSLASGVFLDAFVVRSLLLPAVLQLLGRATWAFPAGLGRWLPQLAPEPGPAGQRDS